MCLLLLKQTLCFGLIYSENGAIMAEDHASIVTEADLKRLLSVLLEEDGAHVPWTLVVDKQNERLSYNAKQREPEVCHKSFSFHW